jgi:tRNA pseudouridine13 synthase
MKLKYRPEDFCVEELPLDGPCDSGRFVLYRLVKKGIGTIEAVEATRRRWNLDARQISYGGLKDRHALTTQYLTIANGPLKPLRQQSFELSPLGRATRPYGPASFRGNRFKIVVRDLTEREAHGALAEVEAVARDGLPNYFDDQRFGSVGYSGEFIAHAWLVGDHERALYLALAEANRFDRSNIKAQKALLRGLWGKWPEAKARLERSSTRSIVTYLVDHPANFRGAFARLSRTLRVLYFSAFQSHLWNLILARWIESRTGENERIAVELKMGRLPFPRGIDHERARELNETAIPLPTARTKAPSGPLGEVANDVLRSFELSWPALRVRHLKDVFFSKGSRGCLMFPQNFECSVALDEHHPGQRAARMSFELSKGSYATILVKRVTDAVDLSRSAFRR